MTGLQFNDFVFQGVPGSRLRDLFDVSQFTLAAWSPVLRPLSCSGQLYYPVQVSCIFLFRSVVFSCSGQLYSPVQVSCILLFMSVVFSCFHLYLFCSTVHWMPLKHLYLVVSSLCGNVVSPVPKTLISFDLFDYHRLISNIYLRLQLPHPVVNSMHADF